MGSSRNYLVVYDWTTEIFLWSCYPSWRSSRILGVAMTVMHSNHSSMLGKMQVAL